MKLNSSGLDRRGSFFVLGIARMRVGLDWERGYGDYSVNSGGDCSFDGGVSGDHPHKLRGI